MELTPYCRAEQQATKARSGATQSSCPGKSGASCSGAVPSTSAGFIAGDAMRCHVVPSCVAILHGRATAAAPRRAFVPRAIRKRKPLRAQVHQLL